MNVEGKRYVGGDFPVHLLTMGKLFNKRLVPCAFGIKIGLYFQKKPVVQRTTGFFNEINPVGFVKCASRVKYGFAK